MGKSIFVLLISAWSLSSLANNSGNLTGTVTDTKTGDPVIGANIYFKGTIIGTISDIKGKYELKNLKTGPYDVVCSDIGYTSIQQTILVRENDTTVVNFALQETTTNLQAVTIAGSLPMSAASSMEIRKIDMQLRPFRTTQDMLRLVPGLVIAQHAGGGKAEQIFLRGFDCDHGTDVSVNVDGIPVNMVSHAHGQGYADLHYVISETVDNIEVNKGPYFTRYGDFATAGAISFTTKDVLDNNLVKLEAGQFNTQKYTLLCQLDNGGAEQNGYIAAQYYHTDGPFDNPQKLQRMNLFGKYFIRLTQNSRLAFSVGGYSSAWNASGQIPTRAVEEGLINRFGNLDNTEGGATDRENINLDYKFRSESGNELDIRTYATNYNFKLFSDFTFFLTDSINGDMIEQTEHRNMSGVNATYSFSSKFQNIHIINRIGSGYRGDNISPQLWHSPNRNRMNELTSDLIHQHNFYVWGEQEMALSPKVKMIWGLRHDFFTFIKDDQVGNALDTTNNGLPHASGYAWQSVFSPKLNFIIQPMRNLDIYLNFGQGFHSNDARDVVIGEKVNELTSLWKREGLSDQQVNSNLAKFNFDPRQRSTGTLPKATGSEIGIRTTLVHRLHLGLAAWYLYLQKEIVYAGDGGTTEISNPTQRKGIDAEARYALASWLWLDGDLSASKGRILNVPADDSHIPLAPTLTASGGISVIRQKGLNASLRVLHIGDRPANEQNTLTAQGYTLFNVNIFYKLGKITFSVYGENLMNADWNEAQFATETRLKGETEGKTDICFTPGNPRNFQFSVAFEF